MNAKLIIDAVREGLKTNNEISISYSCRTTSTNGSYIEIKVGDTLLDDKYSEYSVHNFAEDLSQVIEPLKDEYKDLHVISRKKEFHFYYSGFNSCCTKLVPVSISNRPESSEVKKTGVVSEKYRMVGKKKVMEVINAHPDYELYKRSGFGFRGAQERPCGIEDMVKMLDWMACADVDVVDNEIHVNGFSGSDMW